jgi:GMP synthase (glutamine-hydrolysing)
VKRVIAIRHLAFEDMGYFAEVLSERGIALVYVDAASDDLTQIDPETDDPLVILGGPISVNDRAEFPFIEQELALLRQRLALDKPTLGICLGAQLIARALGARVYPGPEKEIGWSPLVLTPAGEQSPLRALQSANSHVLHWHGETFDLPAGAIRLAASDKYTNQAFSYGQHVLALQFHIEVTEKGLENWYVGHIGEIQQTPGVSVPGLRQQARHHATITASLGRQIFADWLARSAV